MRATLVVAAVLLAACGVVALLTLMGANTGVLGEVVLIWPAIILFAVVIERVFTDSAHGPPFLSAFGVLVFYWIPAVAIPVTIVATKKTVREGVLSQDPPVPGPKDG